jgi:hypothetical protein
MKESISIKMTRIKDVDGNATCSCSINETCEFFRTQRVGTIETCIFAPNDKRFSTPLDRRKNGIGTLIPGVWCPLFKSDVLVN